MPLLETEIWQTHQPRGLRAFAISSNTLGPDDRDTVAAFTAEMGLTMTVLLDYDVDVYEEWRMADADGFAPYPREFIVDRDGTIAYAAATIDPVALAEVLDDLL